jgi:hypothetical protein
VTAEKSATADFRRGDRIRYTGLRGDADGPVGKVVGISKAGLRVVWADGTRATVHPADVRPVTP